MLSGLKQRVYRTLAPLFAKRGPIFGAKEKEGAYLCFPAFAKKASMPGNALIDRSNTPIR